MLPALFFWPMSVTNLRGLYYSRISQDTFMANSTDIHIPKEALEAFRSALSLLSDVLRKLNVWLRARPQAVLGDKEVLDSIDIETSAKELNVKPNILAAAISLAVTIATGVDEKNRHQQFITALAESKIGEVKKPLEILLNG